MNQVKSFIQINNELRPFWEQLINSNFPGSYFTARIVSTHTFDSTTSNVQENCVAIDPKDLGGQGTMLMELVNFSKDLIDPEYRTLYMFKPDKNFRNMPAIYAFKPYTDRNGNSRESFAIRVADLTEVNKTHNSFGRAMFQESRVPAAAGNTGLSAGSGHAGMIPPPAPAQGSFSVHNYTTAPTTPSNNSTTPPANSGMGMPSVSTVAANFIPEAETESPEADDHISKMTIRDHYAMLLNKPVSFKPWLNQLILENQN